MSSRPVYGVIGVGAIAAAIVDGFFRCGGEADFLLSPRGRATSAALAGRHRTARVCADNQSVLDAAEVLLLCPRPQDAPPILEELNFRSDHIVISAIAGMSIADLASLVSPVRDIARVIPLPSIATIACETPIYSSTPSSAAARRLFDPLGGVIECADEDGFNAFSASTATIAAYFRYLQAIGDWLTLRNIPPDAANRYVTATFAGLGGALRSGRGLSDLAAEHATRGGTNELFRQYLEDCGVFDEVQEGLFRVFERVSGQSFTRKP